jgi:hypothetical protein
MTTDEIARRLGAQSRGNRLLARCPSHDDRHPSLSLREGPGGKTLLHCFTGCSVEAIVAALGLEISDLFADAGAGCRGPVSSTIERAPALRSILDREEQRLGFRPPPLAWLKNEARAAVERRFNVRLSRRAAPWWEIPPHDVDPEWKCCVDRATEELALESEFSLEWAPEPSQSLDIQESILRRARQLQRELAGAL